MSPDLQLCYHRQDPALVPAPDAHLHPASPLGTPCSKKQQDTLQLLVGPQSNPKCHMGSACSPQRHQCFPFSRHVRT